MSKKVLNFATFGLSGLLMGSGKKKTPAPEPAPATPVVMPTADDEAIKRARKQTILRRMTARGRDSTMLTGGKLGG